jgi:hypothetical protein
MEGASSLIMVQRGGRGLSLIRMLINISFVGGVGLELGLGKRGKGPDSAEG